MFKGTSASAGIGIGKAVIVEEAELVITRNEVADAEGESQRFKGALEKTIAATQKMADDLASRVGEKEAEIMQALTWSCSFFEDDEDAKESRFEQWLDKVFGEKLEGILMTVVMIFSFIMAIGIFMLLPMFISNICKKVIPSHTVMAILEGFIRIAIFVIYIKMVSRMEDIKRTFMYHGSEHKCINCIEHGLELNVANVRASSKEHKRCGTSFIAYSFTDRTVYVLSDYPGCEPEFAGLFY